MKNHVAIISHDAGGAEILSSWLNHYDYSASVVVEGPAKKIFKEKCPNAEYLNLDEALIKCNWVLSGTGWESNFERKAISNAKNLGIKTVVFLDHWVNYIERFDENGSMILPDQIWVGDKEAERIAKNLFHTVPITLKSNPYFDDLRKKINEFERSTFEKNEDNFLFVCEPIADHAFKKYRNKRHWGYTEHEALLFFIKNISRLSNNIKSIIIRPHPSENINKYNWINSHSDLPIKFGGKKSLLDEILESNIVVGCESMAMVVAILAKKRVISAIPPGGRTCQLPHLNIEKLNLLNKNKVFYND